MRGDGVRVLIVGAGVAGLATARALRAWGAEVELVDRTLEKRGRVRGRAPRYPAPGVVGGGRPRAHPVEDRTRALPAVVRNVLVRRLGQSIYRANYSPLLAPA